MNPYEAIAKELAEKSRYVGCAKCGYIEDLNEEMILFYLVRGWPKHCGETMHLEEYAYQ